MNWGFLVVTAVVALLVFLVFWFILFRRPPDGYSHPLYDNLPGPYSGKWKSGDACPRCKNDVSHREWMSRVCESCGRFVGCSLDWKKHATRRVVIKGEWVWQRRIGNINYLSRDGRKWEASSE